MRPGAVRATNTRRRMFMKQLLILMVFLLAVMLMISGVMAVGNAKQSVQIADRVQQLSNLKAELRAVQKENRLLTGELESVQARNRRLHWEQQAVAKQLSGVLTLSHRGLPAIQPIGNTPAAGVALLEAMAVRHTLAAVDRTQDGSEAGVLLSPAQAAPAGGRICWAAETADGTVPEAVLPVSGAAAGSEDDAPGDGGVAVDGDASVATGSASELSNDVGVTVGGEVAGGEPGASVDGDAAGNADDASDGRVTAVDAGSLSAAAGSEDDAPGGGDRCGGKAGCCCAGSRTHSGRVLAVSEPITVPVSGRSPAEAAIGHLRQQAEQMSRLLRSLLGLVNTLAERITVLGDGI